MKIYTWAGVIFSICVSACGGTSSSIDPTISSTVQSDGLDSNVTQEVEPQDTGSSNVVLEQGVASNQQQPLADESEITASASIPIDTSAGARGYNFFDYEYEHLFTESNITEILPVVMSSLGGNSNDDFWMTMFDIENRLRSGDPAFSEIGFVESRYLRTHSCPDGGRYSAGISSGSPNIETYLFQHCSIDGVVYDGEYTFKPATEMRPTADYEADISASGAAFADIGPQEYTLSHEERFSESSGLLKVEHSTSVDGYASNEFYYYATYSLSNVPVENESGNSYVLSIGGFSSANYEDYVPEYGDISVQIENDLLRDEVDGYVTEGVVFVSVQPNDLNNPNTPGNRFVLDFGNGDPDSFSLFIENDLDTIVSTTVQWTSALNIVPSRINAMSRKPHGL